MKKLKNLINKEIVVSCNAPKMYWNDPDPIDGNDYGITMIKVFEDIETALIKYGGCSEAEVYLNEIENFNEFVSWYNKK